MYKGHVTSIFKIINGFILSIYIYIYTYITLMFMYICFEVIGHFSIDSIHYIKVYSIFCILTYFFMWFGTLLLISVLCLAFVADRLYSSINWTKFILDSFGHFIKVAEKIWIFGCFLVSVEVVIAVLLMLIIYGHHLGGWLVVVEVF